MDKYFYHGTGDLPVCLITVYKILISGIKVRDKNGDSRYNHVCLYRKNDEYDYSKPEALLDSARSGWIDHCFGLVVSPEIEASKVEYGPTTGFNDGKPITNLVDEWRSNGSIPIDKIVGVFVPINSIKDGEDYYQFDDYDIKDMPEELKGKSFNDVLHIVIKMAKSLGMNVYNSDSECFTDVLDKTLQESKKI